ncbi:MAG TPA: O-methyltransferase [Candidatus Methylomirabilis sp.]
MDAALRRLLEELQESGRAHDARRADRRERLRNLEAETAQMLAVLVRATGACRVLEIGTSNGYSALWLADAVADTGGKVTTVEVEPERARMAQANFARAKLQHLIDLRVGDGGQVLAESQDGAWDLIFLDAERPHYVGYWPDLVRSLRPFGLLAVDNVLSHAAEVAAFRALVEGTPGITSALVPIGAGVVLIAKGAGEGGLRG